MKKVDLPPSLETNLSVVSWRCGRGHDIALESHFDPGERPCVLGHVLVVLGLFPSLRHGSRVLGMGFPHPNQLQQESTA